MKILVFGGTGTIGSEIVKQLSEENEVITVGRNSGDINADIEHKSQIEEVFKKVGNVDAIISASGDGVLGPISQMEDSSFALVLKSKVMGQVNIVRAGLNYLNDGGSITLTSGTAAQSPLPGSASISMGCAAVDSFVKAVSMELDNNKRINTVSPTFVKETMEKLGMDSTGGISASDTALAYKESVLGQKTGETIYTSNFAG